MPPAPPGRKIRGAGAARPRITGRGAAPLRVHLRLEFHDEGNGKTKLELRQGPFATGQLGADTRS